MLDIIIPDEIANSLPKNELVVFVGSGFSKPLGFLDWRSLAVKAIDEFNVSYPQVEQLKKGLKENLYDEIIVFDVLKGLNKPKIEEIIKRYNNIEIDLAKLGNHKKIWQVSDRIITTNYDRALELAKPDNSIETICNSYDYELTRSLRGSKWLYHLHGTVNDIGNCIVFSEDYYRLYNKQSAAIEQLRSIAANNTILFVGFSMKDKYVSNLFKNLNMVFNNQLNNDFFILAEKSEQLDKTFLRRIDLPDYEVLPFFLDELIKIKRTRLESPVKITRYLRRRCRTFEPGSEEFNKLMIGLRAGAFQEERAILLNQRISLLAGYEKTMVMAALLENSGRIEEMVDVLESESYQGNKEFARILYLALGYEKLDYIKKAMQLLDRIIAYPVESEMILCAKFNRSVCAEKIERYDEVYFEQFINNRSKLRFTNERIKDKAISNHLIVCKKRNAVFDYEAQLRNTIKYEMKNAARSQSKTLINYLTYKNAFITKDQYEDILSLSQNMTTNARIACLCKLFILLDRDTVLLLKEEALVQVESLCQSSRSEANQKYLADLRRFIDEQR